MSDGIENSVYESVSRVVGIPLNHVSHPRDVHNLHALRNAYEDELILPTGDGSGEDQHHGARVFTPRAGLSTNVTYIDAASLYPNGFRALNVGPDTFIGTKEDLDQSPWTEKDCVWSYIDSRPVKRLAEDESYRNFTDGTYKMIRDENGSSVSTKWRSHREGIWDNAVRAFFLKPSIREGFVAANFEDLIDIKYNFDGGVYEAVKALAVNSGYGVYTDKHFRLFDWRLGESITLFGRKIISFSADYTVKRVRELVPEAKVLIAVGDTDGCGIAVEGVDRDTAMQAVETAAEELNDSVYDQYCAETFNIEGDHHMEIEVESYAPRLFVPADDDQDDYPQTDVGTKKRYAKWETVDEGEEVDEISITGLEAVRSDVAPITKTVQRHVLETLLRSDGPLTAKKELYPYLREQYNNVVNGETAIKKVAKRGGIGQDLHEYGSQSRRPQPLYRGAKYASKFCDDVHLSEGSKPMAVYVDRIHDESLPNTYRAATAEDGCVVDCIAVEDPENLPREIDIDWNRHALKAVKEPLRTIIETMGWRWEDVLHGSEQSGFGDFQ